MNDGMSSVAQNAAGVISPRLAGAIIAGFDVHLRQITFDCLDSDDWRGLPRADRRVAGGRGGVGRAVLRPGGACGDGGVHWLAVRC